MGQFAVISVVAALLLGAVLVFNAQLRTEEADAELRSYHVDRFAREAAMVGLKQVERNLSDHIDDWNLWESDTAAARDTFNVPTSALGTAAYRVRVDSFAFDTSSTVSDKAWVTATGSYEGVTAQTGTLGTTHFLVEAVYEKGLTDVGLPPTFRSAIVSEELIDIRGNVQIRGGVHSNGGLTSSGGTFDVHGAGTYTGTESANDARFSGGVAWADSVDIPRVAIPPASYHSVQTGDWSLTDANDPTTTLAAGWRSVTGMGTSADPYVLYVNGNLTISGDVRLIGYSRIYVNGTVTVNGNATLSPVAGTTPSPSQDVTSAPLESWVATNLPDGTRIGIYATGDITLSGTCFVAAQLYTDAAVRYTGGGHKLLVGGLTTWEPLDIRGNAKIYYTTATRSVEDPGINKLVPEGVRLIAYREWVERP